jgi:Fic family protein
MLNYIWQDPNWPNWQYDIKALSSPLAAIRHAQGRLLGKMESLGFQLRDETWLQTLTQDVLKTSQIENLQLDSEQVRSSLAQKLGLDIATLPRIDRNVEGIVEIMLDATQNYATPLTADRLFAWHGALFPTGRSGLSTIRVATWRDDSNGPMQVISGPIGHEKVHYTAPPAERLASEIQQFLTWFEQPTDLDPVLKAGLAHFWLVTLHPFDDGNGRIARAVGDMALARSEQLTQRFYSLSAQIQQQRNDYYAILERSQKGNINVTEWLLWFLNCLQAAIAQAEQTLAVVLNKARTWEKLSNIELNPRQIKVLNKMLDGFEGNLTTSKWAKLAKCSQDTAHRDILKLIELKVLAKAESSGRSTHYRLVG